MNVNRVHRDPPAAPRSSRANPVRATLGLWMSLALLGGGCGSAGRVDSDCYSTGGGSAETPLTLLTWWQTKAACEHQGEACAAESLQDTYRTCTDGVLEFEPSSNKPETLSIIEGTEPLEPTTADGTVVNGAIINGGVDVYRVAGCDAGGLQEDPVQHISSLGPVDQPVAGFLQERTPDSLRHLVTCNGQWFGALLGLHRLNQLFYHRERLERSGLTQILAARGLPLDGSSALSLTQFEAILEEVSHVYERPLVIVNDSESWSRFMLENLMVATAAEAGSGFEGRDGYTAFWAGLSEKSTASTYNVPRTTLVETLQKAAALARYIELVPENRWRTSLTAAPSDAREAGVFVVTGDWEVPNLAPAYGVRPFPGTDHSFVYSADVLVVTEPVEVLPPVHPMLDLMKALTSSRALGPFSERKHSHPTSTFDAGFTRAKSGQTLFDVDGQHLTGISSLHSYVPHLSFDLLGRRIMDYGRCLVSQTTNDPTADAAAACGVEHDALLEYVLEQYCLVVRGSTDSCGWREGAVIR